MASGILKNVTENNEVLIEVEREIVTVTGDESDVLMLKNALETDEPVLVSFNEETLELEDAF